ncbi:MAG: GNAT family N-acetyltransferase [Chloroflexi bacterium]|nr:GNAT family N-acetyltransferase [Chloroflexota bacterium]MYF80105.1 GNAT family N-acetyltransferase [Chloroflexota bacterium]MYK62314.1 GNAT family N-acetyltransferase [Chloroflexota bacterium]
MPSLPPKQLRMVVDAASVGRLPDVALPLGYEVRGYRPGDESSWAETLQACGFERWNDAEVLAYLEDAERLEGSRVIDNEGRVVAGTFASRNTNDASDTIVPESIGSLEEEGVLDFVVTHPYHRGRGLAKATCTEVAKFFVRLGCQSVSLLTDDWRLPAIHVYLSLGFKPVMNRNDMSGRWDIVYDKLKEQGHDHS